jgi:peptide/nickel transport system permease protein
MPGWIETLKWPIRGHYHPDEFFGVLDLGKVLIYPGSVDFEFIKWSRDRRFETVEVDIIMAFPTVIFALMILSVVGTSIGALILVIALLYSTRVYRLLRAVAMDIEVMEYVEAARFRGEKIWWLMRHEILPNVMPLLVAEFGLRFCFVFLYIAALSFLGLGIQPPTADWGGVIRENAEAISFGILTPL